MMDNHGSGRMRILLLGGTSEASRLARALHERGLDAIFSYAGRTSTPLAQPLPTRIGGFGGVPGLIDFLRAQRITHVIDATHPFAAGMSRNAVAACAALGLALLAVERPAWTPAPADRWIRVDSVDAAVAALPATPQRVFLALGRQLAPHFLAAPQHRYLLRVAEADGLPALPQAQVIVDRGPFALDAERRLFERWDIQWVVSKNAGGEAAWAKLQVARERGCPVVMIERPALPPRPTVASVEEALRWLDHEMTHPRSTPLGV